MFVVEGSEKIPEPANSSPAPTIAAVELSDTPATEFNVMAPEELIVAPPSMLIDPLVDLMVTGPLVVVPMTLFESS